MTAPATRADVVELIARVLFGDDQCNTHWSRLSDLRKEEFLSDGDAILDALEAAGVRLVPAEATEKMADAGWIDKEDVAPSEIYHAMLANSPYAPEEAL